MQNNIQQYYGGFDANEIEVDENPFEGDVLHDLSEAFVDEVMRGLPAYNNDVPQQQQAVGASTSSAQNNDQLMMNLPALVNDVPQQQQQAATAKVQNVDIGDYFLNMMSMLLCAKMFKVGNLVIMSGFDPATYEITFFLSPRRAPQMITFRLNLSQFRKFLDSKILAEWPGNLDKKLSAKNNISYTECKENIKKEILRNTFLGKESVVYKETKDKGNNTHIRQMHIQKADAVSLGIQRALLHNEANKLEIAWPDVKKILSKWLPEFDLLNREIRNPTNTGWSFFALGRLSSTATFSYNKLAQLGCESLFNDFLIYYMSLRNIA